MKINYVIKAAAIVALSLSLTPIASACGCKNKKMDYKDMSYKGEEVMGFQSNWYAGGHIGVSRTHDKAAAGSGNSVTQIGPGWTADLGYKFREYYRWIFSGELGFTQYHDSAENTQTTNVAKTEHFAAYAALVGQYPLPHNFNVLGKLGFAYSYAKKVFTATGASASANAVSPYYGIGLSYTLTRQADLVLQWARVRGNHKTGSTDLTSLGVTYNFV